MESKLLKELLTIDGGGIRGILPAASLANLERDLDLPIGRYFDLISGRSTGGIIAIGLAIGMSAADILKLYEDKGPAIFAQTQSGLAGWLGRRFRWGQWLV
jgi:patatin-like phospholipase/acyl hydrolase